MRSLEKCGAKYYNVAETIQAKKCGIDHVRIKEKSYLASFHGNKHRLPICARDGVTHLPTPPLPPKIVNFLELMGFVAVFGFGAWAI